MLANRLKTTDLRGLLLVAFLSLPSCGESGGPPALETPARTPCSPDVSFVEVSVATGDDVVFDWDPACGVYFLLVEEDASDRWGLIANASEDGRPEEVNIIVPPITYGVAPANALESIPETLVPGRSYEVILWRIIPVDSPIQCLARLDTGCLLAVEEFVR